MRIIKAGFRKECCRLLAAAVLVLPAAAQDLPRRLNFSGFGTLGLAGTDTHAVGFHRDNGQSSLTAAIFMGRQRRLPNGALALPVEQIQPGPDRVRFYQELVNLPLSQVRAYWATLYFSGKAQPPRQTESPEETLQVVAANKGAIGFVEASRVDRRVRGILLLGEGAAP